MSYKCGLNQAFLMVLGILAFLTASASVVVNAQNIRLRSNIDPVPSNRSSAKYADVTADGNIAVLGSYGERGGFIFDISNPDAPVLKTRYNPTPTLQFLEAVVVGNRVYFGSGTGDGVHIVDISNPANPVLLGKINPTTVPNTFNTVHEITVDGDYLYENLNSTSERRIKVINISNPAQPRFVRDITPNELRWIHAVHIRNGKMYTSGWGISATQPGLTEIYDITNIETQAPRLLGQVASGTNTHSSWTSEDGNFLYVCREFFDGELRVYDIRNVAEPVLTKVIKAADLNINAICPHNPMVKGNRLYVAWYQAGVQVFDISNPGDPKRIGQYDTYNPQYSEDEARREAENLRAEPWDIICGSESLARSLPTGYNGNWTAFPLLGEDKVILSDLATGLYIVDTRLNAAPRNNIADFDGDGKTDYSVFTRSTGFWTIENSSNSANVRTQFGTSTDRIMPGDYDGDGKTDIAVFRDGNWYSLNSSNNSFRAVQFGLAGDIPVAADYDGDGKTDPAVFRPTGGGWYILRSTLGFYGQQWGANGDEPIAGDFDGDGKADLTVVRTANGFKTWYTLPSSSSIPQGVQFGVNTDKAVVGDFDGDQASDIAVFRPSIGSWYIKNSQSGNVSGVQFGISSDSPIPADYDGDGKTDIAVYRAASNNWYGIRSSNGSFFARQFGSGNDLPAPCAAQPAQSCVIP